MLQHTSCLPSIHFFISLYLQAKLFFLQIRRCIKNLYSKYSLQVFLFFTYGVVQHCLLCNAVLFVPAALLHVLTDFLLSDPNVTELCWNLSPFQFWAQLLPQPTISFIKCTCNTFKIISNKYSIFLEETGFFWHRLAMHVQNS